MSNMSKSVLHSLATLAVALVTSIGLNAQIKEKTMEQQVFYRTVKVDGLSIFYREAGPQDAPVPWLSGIFVVRRSKDSITMTLPSQLSSIGESLLLCYADHLRMG